MVGGIKLTLDWVQKYDTIITFMIHPPPILVRAVASAAALSFLDITPQWGAERDQGEQVGGYQLLKLIHNQSTDAAGHIVS